MKLSVNQLHFNLSVNQSIFQPVAYRKNLSFLVLLLKIFSKKESLFFKDTYRNSDR